MKTIPMKKEQHKEIRTYPENKGTMIAQYDAQYDAQNDILSIHKGFQRGEHFGGNEEHEDLILDLSDNGKIVGIELMNASRVLALSEKKLSTIRGADFTHLEKEQAIQIQLECNGHNSSKSEHYQKKFAIINTPLLEKTA